MALGTIKGLADLAALDGGKLEAAFRARLLQVLDDLRDRPGDEDAREIVLKMKASPVADAQGGLEGLKVWFELAAKVPAGRTRDYSADYQRSPAGAPVALIYNDLSPEDVGQGTLDEVATDADLLLRLLRQEK